MLGENDKVWLLNGDVYAPLMAVHDKLKAACEKEFEDKEIVAGLMGIFYRATRGMVGKMEGGAKMGRFVRIGGMSYVSVDTLLEIEQAEDRAKARAQILAAILTFTDQVEANTHGCREDLEERVRQRKEEEEG